MFVRRGNKLRNAEPVKGNYRIISTKVAVCKRNADHTAQTAFFFGLTVQSKVFFVTNAEYEFRYAVAVFVFCVDYLRLNGQGLTFERSAVKRCYVAIHAFPSYESTVGFFTSLLIAVFYGVARQNQVGRFNNFTVFVQVERLTVVHIAERIVVVCRTVLVAEDNHLRFRIIETLEEYVSACKVSNVILEEIYVVVTVIQIYVAFCPNRI